MKDFFRFYKRKSQPNKEFFGIWKNGELVFETEVDDNTDMSYLEEMVQHYLKRSMYE
jgi:hypothetical protein